MSDEELDRTTSGRQLADEAGYSRAQFYRRYAIEVHEPPMRTRKRLLLERAAFQLGNSDTSVTEVAFDAGFGSLEGFARAFRRAFGISSSRYRQLGVREYRFDLTERVHFAPGTSQQGDTPMDMTRTLVAEHFDRLATIVNACEHVDLKAKNLNVPSAFPWPCAPRNLRELLDYCFQHEPWLSVITDERPDDCANLEARVSWGRERFGALIDTVERENLWGLTFVDKDCQPPQVFSYGFIVQFTITYNTYHRVLLEAHLREMGLIE
ncbi:MAG: helix-turn-helix transcriptional regulator [Fimbriimonas sp.]